MVGIIYKYCIGVRNIKPRFYNGCCNQNIIVALNKVEHYILNCFTIHFAMNNSRFDIWTNTLDLCLQLPDVFNPVMNYKYLAVPGYLIFNPLPYYILIEPVKLRNNWHPVGRR